MRFSAFLAKVAAALAALVPDAVAAIRDHFIQHGSLPRALSLHPELTELAKDAEAAIEREARLRGAAWAREHLPAAVAAYVPALVTPPAPPPSPPPVE